jgi:hypothetical protein
MTVMATMMAVPNKTERMKAALVERLDVHERDGTLPTSNRFLFYELEGKDDGHGVLVSKVKTGARRADQDLIDALTALREQGAVPWDWIVDETRYVESVWRANTIADDLREYLDVTKFDAWQSRVRPFVICESRSLAGVLRNLCYRYGVNSTSTNGQNNGFLRTKLARSFDDQKPEQEIFVLYCGDLDIGGTQIEHNTRSVLEEACKVSFRWERLMLTEAQVKQHRLPSIMKTDRRYKHGGGAHEAWECEVLSQRLIVELLESRLKKLLLPKTIEQVERKEKRERAQVRVTKRRKA